MDSHNKGIVKYFLLSILFIFTTLLYAQTGEPIIKEGETLNVERCIEIALKLHPSIMKSRYEVMIKQSQLGQAKAGYFPKVDVTTGYTRNSLVRKTDDPYNTGMGNFNYNNASVTLNQTIYDFGKTPTDVNIKKLDLESSKHDLDDALITLTNSVRLSYYSSLKAKRTKDVNKEAVDQYKEHLAQAKLFFEAGKKPKYDVTKAEVDLSNAKLDLIGAENDFNIATVTLRNAIGLELPARFEIEDNLSPQEYRIPLEDALSKAYQNRADLRSLAAQKDASAKSIEFARKEYYPKITGSAAYNFTGSQFPLEQGANAGVALSMNIFEGYSTVNKVEEARAKMKSLEAKIETVKLQILLEIQQAYLNLQQAKEKITNTEIQMKQAAENLELATLRYKAGLGSLLEVTDATVASNKARLVNISALYDYRIAQANIEKAMGNK